MYGNGIGVCRCFHERFTLSGHEPFNTPRRRMTAELIPTHHAESHTFPNKPLESLLNKTKNPDLREGLQSLPE